MIGQLRGQIVAKRPPQVTIDVGGVGYDLMVPMSSLPALPGDDSAVTLLTLLIVRDDALALYGFASEPERELFRELIRISGVGPKMALTILSGMSVADFVATIDADDSDRLTGLPGVGKKTAARLLVEMRDRLASGDFSVKPHAATAGSAPRQAAGARAEARDALVALGYKPGEAERLLTKSVDDGEAEAVDVETLIRRALKCAVG